MESGNPEQYLNYPLPLTLDRHFVVDCIARTHRQLLLRSEVFNPNGIKYATRVDIVFKVVKAVKMVFILPKLSIRSATEFELDRIKEECGEDVFRHGYEKAYIISGGPHEGYIVASSAFFSEINENEHPQPMSLLHDVEHNFAPTTVYELIQ
ncbi:hypothetical protein [Nocardia lasii]|uniref:Uncharacterized protein n=1 Tax=Nocardia lasii TaxID=1616107 RepID=A0ABW1JLU2_9NOCA